MKTNQCQKIAEERGYPDLFNNLEENAIRDTNEIIKFTLKNNKPPHQYLKDLTEAKLGRKLCSLKKAKQGRYCIFYPILQTLADEAGLPDLFDLIDLEEQAIKATKEIISFVKVNDKLPIPASKDSTEAKLGNKLHALKTAKQRKGESIFYPILQTLADEAGLPDLFDRINLEENAIKDTREIIKFILKNDELPTHRSKDPIEKKLGIRLNNLKTSKQGKGNAKFYPILQTLADEAGLPDLFNSLEENAIKGTTEIISFFKANKRPPNGKSKDSKEAKLGRRLSTLKKTKQGKGNGKFYPILQTLADEAGLPNLFNTRKKRK